MQIQTTWFFNTASICHCWINMVYYKTTMTYYAVLGLQIELEQLHYHLWSLYRLFIVGLIRYFDYRVFTTINHSHLPRPSTCRCILNSPPVFKNQQKAPWTKVLVFRGVKTSSFLGVWGVLERFWSFPLPSPHAPSSMPRRRRRQQQRHESAEARSENAEEKRKAREYVLATRQWPPSLGAKTSPSERCMKAFLKMETNYLRDLVHVFWHILRHVVIILLSKHINYF